MLGLLGSFPVLRFVRRYIYTMKRNPVTPIITTEFASFGAAKHICFNDSRPTV